MNDKIKNSNETKDIYVIQYKWGEIISASDGIINEVEKKNILYFILMILIKDHLGVLLFYIIIK